MEYIITFEQPDCAEAGPRADIHVSGVATVTIVISEEEA